MRAFVTLLNSIPFGLACFLAPLVCFLWVLFSDAWSLMLFIFLVGLMALLGMFLILCVSGFLGPFGVLGLPILYSAYGTNNGVRLQHWGLTPLCVPLVETRLR